MLTIYIVKDANRRMVMLHAAAKFTSDKSVLKQIYYSRICCKLDQSAVVWSSNLTQKKAFCKLSEGGEDC